MIKKELSGKLDKVSEEQIVNIQLQKNNETSNEKPTNEDYTREAVICKKR